MSNLKTMLGALGTQSKELPFDRISANAFKASERANDTNEPADHHIAANLHDKAAMMAHELGLDAKAKLHTMHNDRHRDRAGREYQF